MRGGNGDRDRRFAYREPADPVDDVDAGGAKPRDRVVGDPLHLAFGHTGVGLVLEEKHAAPVVDVAHRPEEQRHRAVPIPPRRRHEGGEVDRFGLKPYHVNLR